SVALISAIGTMGQSMQDNALQKAIYDSGAYHFGYGEAEPKLYEQVKNNVLVGQVGVLKAGPATELADGFEMKLVEANPDAFALAPLHLQEGHWPQSPDEVAVEQWMLARLPGEPKVGDTTELNGPDGSAHTYRIAGVLNNSRSGQQEAASKAYTLMNGSAAQSGTLMVLATFKHGVDISDHLPEFRKLSEEQFAVNREVLGYMGESPDGNFNLSLRIIFGTLIALVVLSTAAVIYNIFHISVLERIRQFGLLRTIGASPRQIRGLVFREATVLAAIGIPLGLLCGWGALWLVIRLMLSAGFSILDMEDFQLTWHNWIMFGSVLVGLLSVYLAAWLPARKAARVSPVEAVRGAGSIVRESFRRGLVPSPLSSFGVGGKMAAKNIRRNRSKFRITTFSIVISVTLFIVFHYFTQEMFRITTASNEETRIAFSIYENNIGGGGLADRADGEEDDEAQQREFLSAEQMAQIAAIPGVRGAYGNYGSMGMPIWAPEGKFNHQFSAISGRTMDTKSKDGVDYVMAYSLIEKYDDARLKEAEAYLTAGTADPRKLEAENAVLLVQSVKPSDPETGKRTLLDMTQYKVGDKLLIDFTGFAARSEAEAGTEDAASSGGGANGSSSSSSGSNGSGGDGGNGGGSKSDESSNVSGVQPVLREVTVGGILSQAPFGTMYQEDTLMVMAPSAVYDQLVDDYSEDSIGSTRMYGVDVALEDGADDEAVRQALQSLVGSLPNARLIDVAAEQKQERQFNLQMKIFIYGFLTVIGLIGSLNIVNTVQTNLLLRRREFGLLQAVGMTPGQLKRMASLEGLWFGALGSFWGLLCGIGLSYFLNRELNGIEGSPFHFPWGGALIACGAALAVGLLSVQGPLRRISKLNLIESLREEA
ncbi:ABC transporter permease, partial [Cohnella lubricantis]